VDLVVLHDMFLSFCCFCLLAHFGSSSEDDSDVEEDPGSDVINMATVITTLVEKGITFTAIYC
jgi:hypothetical protein